jgi:hypothetical protein
MIQSDTKMSLSDEIESYLIGVKGSTRRHRVNRRITPELKAYRERGSKKGRENDDLFE